VLHHRQAARAAALSLLALSAAPAAALEFTNIVDTSGGLITFGHPSLDNNGVVTFTSAYDVFTSGVFAGSGGPVATLYDTTTPGYFAFSAAPMANDHGDLVFLVMHPDFSQSIFLGDGSGGPVTFITGDSTNAYTGFGDPVINNAGTIAFQASTTSGTTGIYAHASGSTSTVVDNTGAFDNFSFYYSINAAGTVAFQAGLDGGGQGIYAAGGGSVTTIAQTGGQFSFFFDSASINDHGQVVFGAALTGGGEGIFLGDGDQVITIADSSGPFVAFGFGAGINNNGTVAFMGQLEDTRYGIFTGGDPETDAVILTGDILFGSEVVDIRFYMNGLNDLDQIAFGYTLANGLSGIAVVTVPAPATLPTLAVLGLAALPRRRGA